MWSGVENRKDSGSKRGGELRGGRGQGRGMGERQGVGWKVVVLGG